MLCFNTSCSWTYAVFCVIVVSIISQYVRMSHVGNIHCVYYRYIYVFVYFYTGNIPFHANTCKLIGQTAKTEIQVYIRISNVIYGMYIGTCITKIWQFHIEICYRSSRYAPRIYIQYYNRRMSMAKRHRRFACLVHCHTSYKCAYV